MDAFTSFVDSLLSIALAAFALFIQLVLTILSFLVVLFEGIIHLFGG
jgi:hypothetical protein